MSFNTASLADGSLFWDSGSTVAFGIGLMLELDGGDRFCTFWDAVALASCCCCFDGRISRSRLDLKKLK
ncbi:unnamed protein product [Strongylus vulgaris]|uniref:Uncharacterized protein n=1 Tax=Strongylus vulgaris TaxID=40348 RepID=A0A3P7JJ34_STRVU|nr:unnamed protein product [Strongylus vulgaris]